MPNHKTYFQTEDRKKMEENLKFLQEQFKFKVMLQSRAISGLLDFVTEWEAQQLLGVKRTTLYHLKRQGSLEFKTINKKTYYLTNSIANYVLTAREEGQ